MQPKKELVTMEEINWRQDWEEARAEAQKANLPLLLEFYLDGCPHCSRLATETLKDPAVVKAVNERFIPLRLEGRGHMDLVRQYQVTGAPTTILFSPDGQEKHRFVGFQTAEEYLKELEKGG
uniref:DUF255 domain-containing protein n=1 Tax=Desulfobacca acetoxidans TaxID=60893 RepID=A0A7V6DNR1_9BACT